MSNSLPLSLSAYFVPPTDCIGEFGMLTGYSADTHFLNDALDKFTQTIKSQRAYEGSGYLAMMLDPNHHQISAVDCPGLVHLAAKSNTEKKFRLLHAKVALLLFKNKLTEQKIIRVIVSTGNWTRQTIEDSLDMVWSIDYEVAYCDDHQVQTDIAKVNDFINHTLTFFKIDILNSVRIEYEATATATALRFKHYQHVLGEIKPVKNVRPRFFDNTKQALITQLPHLIKTHSNNTKCNYLALGSGFYEGGDNKTKVPKVISEIEKVLQQAGLLTKTAEKDIYVNPDNCQLVAQTLDILNTNDWSVRPAYDAVYQSKNYQRSLHAKFIFSAKNGNDDICKRSWLYLGSGNLTTPGFLSKASLHGGNLEAGVVFSPEELSWYGEDDSANCISDKLPINWDEETIITDATQLCSGKGMPELEGEFLAAPISYFTICSLTKTGCLLRPDTDDTKGYQVWYAENYACDCKGENIIWPDNTPRQVKVTWNINDETHCIYIPVFDEFGRMAATALPELEIDDAWNLLGAFPTLPAEDGFDGEVLDESHSVALNCQHEASGSNYYINKMMLLIEHVAQKQTALDPFNWEQWCYRLEQIFCQMSKSAAISYFKKININPLSPLWAAPFRPHFAEDSSTEQGRLYESILRKIEHSLELNQLITLGDKGE